MLREGCDLVIPAIRGICPVCSRSYSVNPDGGMRAHSRPDGATRCEGTHQTPSSVTSPPPKTEDSLEHRVLVLEQKLDIALRTVALITASAKPGIEWMDATLAKIEDPRQIGVPRK